MSVKYLRKTTNTSEENIKNWKHNGLDMSKQRAETIPNSSNSITSGSAPNFLNKDFTSEEYLQYIRKQYRIKNTNKKEKPKQVKKKFL